MPPVDYLFDQGSLSSYSITDPAVPTVRIVPKSHWNAQWAFWCVRSKWLAGKTPHFLIAKADHFGLVANEWIACWSISPDTDTWYSFNNVTIGATDIEIYHNTAFPGGTIYIAAFQMYPFSRTQRKMSEWTANSLVSNTASTTNFILGNATARDNGDNRNVAALPFYGFKLTNATAGTKNVGVLTSGNHPSETPGSYQLEGAIDWLLTTGDTQKFLLDYFTFYCYPSLNPQGRWGGWFRSGPEQPTFDHNRYWDAGGIEDIDAFKTAWTADYADTMDVGFDYHSWMAADGAKSLAADSTTAIWVAFLARMAVLDATFVKRVDDATVSMLGNYWAGLNVNKLCGHIDHGGVTTLGPANWKTTGAQTLQAVVNLLASGYFTQGPDVGSRSFDGLTDRIDWAPVADLTAHALSISLWAYADSLPVNGYMLCVHNSTDSDYGIVLNANTAAGNVNFIVRGATDLNHGAVNGTNEINKWIHWAATWTGVHNDFSTIHIYKNGVEVAYVTEINGAAEVAHTGSWSLGGRIYSDTRNYPGHLAQVGVWDRVLSAGEITNLAAGYAPSLYTTGLQFHFLGNTNSLTAVPGGLGTADGTTFVSGVGEGPGIIYP